LTKIRDVTLNKVKTIIVIVTIDSQIFLKKFWIENFIILDNESINIL